MAINKKSAIFVQSLWKLVKLIASWVDNFHKVSQGLDKNCRFFINGQLLDVSCFFSDLISSPLHANFFPSTLLGSYRNARVVFKAVTVVDQKHFLTFINMETNASKVMKSRITFYALSDCRMTSIVNAPSPKIAPIIIVIWDPTMLKLYVWLIP